MIALPSLKSLRRVVLLLCALAAPVMALDVRTPFGEVITTVGSGQSTVVNLVENPDGTIVLDAVQSGHLAHIGAFTATFSYLATIDYNTGTTLLTGDGVLMTGADDQLFVDVTILEVGPDYPRPYTGVLKITGGTGRFAHASGLLEVTGVDAESLTDSFALAGLIRTRTH
jgi:hypothetical protein